MCVPYFIQIEQLSGWKGFGGKKCQNKRHNFHEMLDYSQRSNKKKKLNELRKQYIQEKGCNVIEMYEYDWWKKYKTDKSVKQHLREPLPYK